jgi:tRNA(Arg) A34 adenosine deaminase TadA
MCAAAHAWVGLGRVVYAMSTAQLGTLRAGDPAAPVRPLAVQDVAPQVVVEGPAPELVAEVTALHHRSRGD